MSRPREGAERVGKAYLCRDGIVRWVTSLSTRGFYHLLWRNETGDVWHYGGRIRAQAWEKVWPVEEVEAPGPGQVYRYCNALGVTEDARTQL